MARHQGPIAVPKNIEPWLYNALNRLNSITRQSTAGLAAIVRGETPDGSGNPLVPGLGDFFFKPGIIGGQTGHGDTAAGGDLIFSSTRHTDKGLIYLGTALNTAYDELNSRLGIGTAAPDAKLHVKGEPAFSVYWRPSESVSGAGFTLTHAFNLTMSEVVPDTTSYIGAIATNPSQIMALTKDAVVGSSDLVPSPNSSWVLRFSHIRVGGSDPITFSWALNDQSGTPVKTGSGSTTGTGIVTTEVPLSLAEATALFAGGSVTEIQFAVSNFAGLPPPAFTDNKWRLTQVEIEIPSTDGGTGAGGYTALFDVDSTQSVDNTQWRSSAGSAYLSVTAGGRLTVESTGSMRFVPGAGADKIMVSDAEGDLSLVAVSGDVTQAAGVFTIANDAVTFAKMQNSTAASRLIGRGSAAGAGDFQEITLGTGLTMTGTVLSGSSLSGWEDDGTVVRLTTSTDQVGIGTATPGASLGVVNVNAISDVVLKVTGKASQSGSLISVLNSSARNIFSVSPTGTLQLGNATDTGNIIINIGGDAGSGPTVATLMWKENPSSLGAPSNTADYVGCVGARLYAYKDVAGTFDVAYGQGNDAWVLVSDESIEYNFYTGGTPPFTPFLRCTWAGNGDFTNYGFLYSRKSLGAVTPGIPQLRLEETGSGTQYISLRAPAAVTANRTQLLFNMNGSVPLVGDDPPAVAAGSMGKVDLTAQAAAIASTNLTNGAAVGLYAVEYVLTVTTLDATAGTIQFQTNFTDVLGATNQAGAALALTATGRQTGRFIVQLSSGELSYQTNLVTVGGGAARYAIYVRVVYLG